MLFALVSFLPGGLGFSEASLAAVLIGFGVPAPVAAAIAGTDRVAETWIPSAIGLLLRPTKRRTVTAVEARQAGFGRLLRTRRTAAVAVLGLGAVQLWLAATRRPFIDASAVSLDPRTGALRDSRYSWCRCRATERRGRIATGGVNGANIETTSSLTSITGYPDGRLRAPNANRDPEVAPQGAYRCMGTDRLGGLTVRSSEEWNRVAQLIGRPDLADDPSLRELSGRHARHDELDAAISA